MIRVVYRWKVQNSGVAEFVEHWRKTTQAIHETTDGALGSFCLQDIEHEDEISTVALWRTEEQWRRFIGTADRTSMSRMHELATQLSARPYRQLGDETLSGEFPGCRRQKD